MIIESYTIFIYVGYTQISLNVNHATDCVGMLIVYVSLKARVRPFGH